MAILGQFLFLFFFVVKKKKKKKINSSVYLAISVAFLSSIF
jgi:hypothetical protein